MLKVKKTLSETFTPILLDEIKSGIYANADRLPSENEIAQYFGMSRTIIRDCLSILEREGFITRQHGIGTIINKHVLDVKVRIDLEQEFMDIIKAAGYTAGIEEVSYKFIESKEIAEKLKIVNKNLLLCKRIITANKKRVIYCEDYISEVIIKNKKINSDIFQKPIFEFLEKYCNTKVYMDLSEVMAIKSDKFISEKLNIDVDIPLLYIDEVGYNIVGQPVLYSKEYYVNGFIKHMLLRKKI